MILHINFTIPFRPSVQFFNLPTIRYIIENLQSSGSGTISENFFLNLTIVFSNFFWFSHGGGRREIYRTSTIYLIPYYHAHSRLKSKKGTIFKKCIPFGSEQARINIIQKMLNWTALKSIGSMK